MHRFGITRISSSSCMHGERKLWSFDALLMCFVNLVPCTCVTFLDFQSGWLRKLRLVAVVLA